MSTAFEADMAEMRGRVQVLEDEADEHRAEIAKRKEESEKAEHEQAKDQPPAEPAPASGSLSGEERGSGAQKAGRQVEQLAILALAIIFGLIGLAVHVLFIVAIVVMAVLFTLMASELRGKRSGSIASVVVSSAVAEAKSFAADLTSDGPNGEERERGDSESGPGSPDGQSPHRSDELTSGASDPDPIETHDGDAMNSEQSSASDHAATS
jgi:hypothetical protein